MKSILTYPNRIYNNFTGKSKQKKQAGLLGRCFERGPLMELDYQAIGVRIRRLRKERGLTQQTLAEMSGQEPSNISHIERGATKLSLPTLVSVANALEVTVDQILCDSLPASRSVFETEAAHILSDCSHLELKIITETIRTLKENLRRLKLSE